LRAAAPQARGRVRIIGGVWRSRQIPVPAIAGLRPTPDRVRQTVFDWLGHLGSGRWQSLSGTRILDAFAGCGALGFEAASRGASEVHLLENHPRALASLRHAKALLDATQVCVHAADALHFMDAVAVRGDRFDLVFLDPPFASGLILPALERAARCLAPHGLVYLEAARSWESLHPGQAPTDFSVLRQARAGGVHYHLLQHRA